MAGRKCRKTMAEKHSQGLAGHPLLVLARAVRRAGDADREASLHVESEPTAMSILRGSIEEAACALDELTALLNAGVYDTVHSHGRMPGDDYAAARPHKY